ncbi:MAG TPA: glucose 1-dehydrogenase [Chloroflexota bacterium]|jgi:NAD(P)-dependent dehydrogenase (short-subunit alcohol dehydrogenase family)|nr:glucose 1-dehydrogenase [Chloroflexota bacterium]
MAVRQRFRLDNKTAFVTGGASGIGAATVRAFAEQGANVVIGDVNQTAGTALAEQLGAATRFERLDVTDAESCQAGIAVCVSTFGRLDVLVNCAGIGLVGNVQETQRQDWDRLLAVNVTGVFLCSQAGVNAMLSQRPSGGVVINIASVAALVGIERRFAYSATKGAVLAMTRQMAIDYVQSGIRCNAICPGTVYSPFVEAYLDRFHQGNKAEVIEQLHARQPLGRMGKPEEIADMAVYLASDEAAFMTGSGVVIDGGLTAR